MLLKISKAVLEDSVLINLGHRFGISLAHILPGFHIDIPTYIFTEILIQQLLQIKRKLNIDSTFRKTANGNHEH